MPLTKTTWAATGRSTSPSPAQGLLRLDRRQVRVLGVDSSVDGVLTENIPTSGLVEGDRPERTQDVLTASAWPIPRDGRGLAPWAKASASTPTSSATANTVAPGRPRRQPVETCRMARRVKPNYWRTSTRCRSSTERRRHPGRHQRHRTAERDDVLVDGVVTAVRRRRSGQLDQKASRSSPTPR